MKKWTIHPAVYKSDFERLKTWFLQAREDLNREEIDQWQDWPALEASLKTLLIAEEGYFVYRENEPIGFYGLSFYDQVYEKYRIWSNESYGAVHRLVMNPLVKGEGLSRQLFTQFERQIKQGGRKSVRIDTHSDNQRMRHILKQEEYRYCGKICLLDGSERLAYEKCIKE